MEDSVRTMIVLFTIAFLFCCACGSTPGEAEGNYVNPADSGIDAGVDVPTDDTSDTSDDSSREDASQDAETCPEGFVFSFQHIDRDNDGSPTCNEFADFEICVPRSQENCDCDDNDPSIGNRYDETHRWYEDTDDDGFGNPDEWIDSHDCQPPWMFADNGVDNCPYVENPEQGDFNNDGIGDACDPTFDWDGDCLCDHFPGDEKGGGNWCEGSSNSACTSLNDRDCDDTDANIQRTPIFYPDGDGDGIGGGSAGPLIIFDCNEPDILPEGYSRDWDDNCPNVFNPEQENFNGDGYGDACDHTFDWDGDCLCGPFYFDLRCAGSNNSTCTNVEPFDCDDNDSNHGIPLWMPDMDQDGYRRCESVAFYANRSCGPGDRFTHRDDLIDPDICDCDDTSHDLNVNCP